jgi:hypothetical protein
MCFSLTAARIHCKKCYELTKFFLCIKHNDDIARREHLGLHLQRRHLQQIVAKIGLLADELLVDRMRPRVEHQPCPASSAGRQATTAVATPAAGVPPDGSADSAFRTSVVYQGFVSFYPGYVETRLRKISVSSPVSFLTAEFPRHLRRQRLGEDRERGPARLYYYK